MLQGGDPDVKSNGVDSLDQNGILQHLNTAQKEGGGKNRGKQIEIPELEERDSEDQMNFLVFCKSIKNSTLQGGSKP